MLKKLISLFLLTSLVTHHAYGQHLCNLLHSKTFFYQASLGIGEYFSAPRAFNVGVTDQKLPVLSLGVGKIVGSNLSIISTLSVQNFASKEQTNDKNGISI